MQARMEVIRGAKTKELRLRLPTVIGRGGDSKIKLPASTVSRHHCEIYEYDGQIVVRDLGSSNGTIVNGHRIKGPTFLTADDEVTIGPVTVRLDELKVTTAAQSTTTQYTAAPAEEVAPTFEDLPAEKDAPIEAETTSAPETSDSATDADVSTEDDDSILQYAEPKSAGRSFVGITPAEDSPDSVDEAPVFEGLETAEKEVNSDDSALHNFFEKLDGDS